jgi:acyl dehydratase
MSSDRPKGKYFEELEPGEFWESPARTITETDVVVYSGFSGDYHPLHTDEEFARKSQFGGRILHGPAAFAIATGLESRLGLKDGTSLAFLGMNWNLKAPVMIGDTIRVRESVASKRESKKLDRGLVVFDVQILNQKDTVVQEGQWSLLILRRPAATTAR